MNGRYAGAVVKQIDILALVIASLVIASLVIGHWSLVMS